MTRLGSGKGRNKYGSREETCKLPECETHNLRPPGEAESAARQRICALLGPRKQLKFLDERLRTGSCFAIHRFHMGFGAAALCSCTDSPVSDFAQTVKQQADIVKVIEGYIRLRKAGAQRLHGAVPVSQGEDAVVQRARGAAVLSTASAARPRATCFSFVGKIENVGFPEAVRIVAQKCGIPLPKREFSSPEEAAGARLRAKLLELHETAAAWFEEQLRGPGGALAREYLAGRGLSDEGIKKFRIGYAPDSFNALRDRLSGMADEETLRASGLFSSKEQGDGSQGPLYDRFRKRVMFPIANEGGRVIAFTARTLETGEKAGAKYINSPETPLYSKGQVLFNLDKAKAAIRQLEFALLVEGQMDCISVFLARDSERDCDQRDGFHRAAGGDSEAAHLECDRELRSRRGGGECGREVDCAADRGGFRDQDRDA